LQNRKWSERERVSDCGGTRSTIKREEKRFQLSKIITMNDDEIESEGENRRTHTLQNREGEAKRESSFFREGR